MANFQNDWINEAWENVVKKIDKTSLRIGATFPHVSRAGKYDNERPSWWTAGFWPGLLWLIYRETGNEKLAKLAKACESQLDKPLWEFHELGHDVGFMWSLTSVAQYKLLKNEESKKRGLIAASHLAGRFNIKGNFIRAWGNDDISIQGWVIIDCLMNLPLLFWASETIKDPRFRHMAIAHADTVLKEIIRPDGSVPHITCFDPNTGEKTANAPGQGYSESSAWSRGMSWAIYGMALCYSYTGEKRYIDAAKTTAHYFLSNLPEDFVPYWDFRTPKGDKGPRDSSAAACAASGLIEISRLVDESESMMYYNAALKIIKSLYENYGAWGTNEEGLLLSATGNYAKNKNVDMPIIYGDYYFVEALSKLRGNTELFW